MKAGYISASSHALQTYKLQTVKVREIWFSSFIRTKSLKPVILPEVRWICAAFTLRDYYCPVPMYGKRCWAPGFLHLLHALVLNCSLLCFSQWNVEISACEPTPSVRYQPTTSTVKIPGRRRRNKRGLQVFPLGGGHKKRVHRGAHPQDHGLLRLPAMERHQPR